MPTWQHACSRWRKRATTDQQEHTSYRERERRARLVWRPSMAPPSHFHTPAAHPRHKEA
jgi:hypothetical protein